MLPSPKKPRVLVADDDREIVKLLTEILEAEKYKVVVAHDGGEALRILKSDADFRAAILDLKMPNLRGIDVIRYMRTEKRLMRIPSVMITGDSDLKLVGESFAAGASVFLAKPFTAADVQRTLRLLVKSPNGRAG